MTVVGAQQMLKKVNYLNIKHELTPTHFKGGPQFINYFPINGKAVAVYKNTNEIEKKIYNYKNYMLLFHQDGKYMVGSLDELPKIKVVAAKCELCGDVIFSCYRHDYQTCSCESTSIDGGQDDYVHTTANAKLGTLNLLTDRFKEDTIGKSKKSKPKRARISSRGKPKTPKRTEKTPKIK